MGFAKIQFSALTLTLLLSGCAVGPDYLRPEIAVPSNYSGSDQGPFKTDSSDYAWWKQFNDDELNSLIDRATASNKDLNIAKERLVEARALLQEARFDLYPTVHVGGGYNRSLTSTANFKGFPNVNNSIRSNELYQLGFDATWELDFFGRVRREVESRDATVGAFEADLRNTLVSVIGEVGRNYVELRGLQNQLKVSLKNAENQKQTLELTKARLEGGQATELDTARAQAQLNNTLSSIPPTEAAIRRTMYRIAVLLGQQPQVLVQELSVDKPLPKLPELNSIADPATLLRRRPDIQAAERRLAAATAAVGVAVGDLYPRITFVGSIGDTARTPNDFGKYRAERWSFGPNISWAAFDLGRVRAAIKAADSRNEQALNEFEQTVLSALEETEDALVTFGSARRTVGYLTEASNASKRAAELANIRYKDGVADFLTVLDSERTALDSEQRLVQSQIDSGTALVAVYKALGGGWEVYRPQDENSKIPGDLVQQVATVDAKAPVSPGATQVSDQNPPQK